MQFRLLKRYLEGIKKDASQTANISIDSGSQTRTDDNLINSQVLYQLSYAGIICYCYLNNEIYYTGKYRK